jgi:hypothetical protein
MKLINALKQFPQIGADISADERRFSRILDAGKPVNFILKLNGLKFYEISFPGNLDSHQIQNRICMLQDLYKWKHLHDLKPALIAIFFAFYNKIISY